MLKKIMGETVCLSGIVILIVLACYASVSFKALGCTYDNTTDLPAH